VRVEAADTAPANEEDLTSSRRSCNDAYDTRAFDGDGVATLAQATQQRLGQCRIGEEVGPGRVRQICCNQPWLAMMALFHELEEDVCLLGFYVDIPEFIDCKDIHVGQRFQ
jgi:hypothetical protein